MNRNIISQQTSNVFNIFCSTTCHIKIKKITKEQMVSPKHQNLKKIINIYFKINLNICCYFQILAEYNQSSKKQETEGNNLK